MNQYYRVHAVIDLDAICHNIREVKRVVGEGVKVMPVIKADGYGHGAVPIAKELNKIGVDAFAVAILEEGITLRNNVRSCMFCSRGSTSDGCRTCESAF